jgi:hypothetical protein
MKGEEFILSHKDEKKVFTQKTEEEKSKSYKLWNIASKIVPHQGNNWNEFFSLFLKRQSLSRILYYNEVYQHIINVPGSILELGVQWGSTLSTLINLRGMYEPYNSSRVVYGFDTFSGFPAIDEKDGTLAAIGDYEVIDNYDIVLEDVLKTIESFSPLNHIKKFDLIKGNVVDTLPIFLKENPHLIISMIIFDMDIYEPTKKSLEIITDRLTKGSVLVFDELHCKHFPGETLALKEALGINKLRLIRNPHQTYCSYAIWE